MPTTRPRYAITETPEVARALETARRRWPEDGDRPSRLILRLINAGSDALSPELKRERQARIEALRDAAGSLDYPENYLDMLRNEWPI